MSTPTLIGRGIYDSHELARIVRRRTTELDTWSRPTSDHQPLLHPTQGRLYSFHDLITAAMAATLRRDREVQLTTVRHARDFLASALSTDYPMAHDDVVYRLATVGRSIYWDSDGEGDWLDVGRGGQAPIQPIIEPLLRAVDFGSDHLASRWTPTQGVVLDPTVQAGAPCVQGTRVPTLMLAELYDDGAGEDVEDLASDYGLPPALVRAAVRWEDDLAKAA